MPAHVLASLSYEARELEWNEYLSSNLPSTSHFVAETGSGEIIGFSGAGPERDGSPRRSGEIYFLYVLESYQGWGIGRRLFMASAQQLLRDGFDSMVLWVLEDNHSARRFYESLEGAPLGRRTSTVGGADVASVSYGWKDIANLPTSDPLDALVGSVDVEPDDDYDALIYEADL